MGLACTSEACANKYKAAAFRKAQATMTAGLEKCLELGGVASYGTRHLVRWPVRLSDMEMHQVPVSEWRESIDVVKARYLT